MQITVSSKTKVVAAHPELGLVLATVLRDAGIPAPDEGPSEELGIDTAGGRIRVGRVIGQRRAKARTGACRTQILVRLDLTAKKLWAS